MQFCRRRLELEPVLLLHMQVAYAMQNKKAVLSFEHFGDDYFNVNDTSNKGFIDYLYI